MKEIKKVIIEAVQDSIDLTDNQVSISVLNTLLDQQLPEQLALYGVVPSYYQVVQETRKLGLQEVTAGLKTLEQAKKAMKENEQWFDNMHIMAKIDN